MDYICLNCGHHFEDGEEKRWTEPSGEPMTGCPICGEGYTIGFTCKRCGGSFLECDLYDGWCKECLLDMVDYDTFRQYIEDNNLLVHFVFTHILEMSAPDDETEKERELCKRLYYNALMTASKQLYDNMIQYVCSYGDDMYDFAEWLNRKGVQR